MPAPPSISAIEKAINHPLFPSPEGHLPLDLHLLRFLQPGKKGKPVYLLDEEEQIIGLNLAKLDLREDQLGFLEGLDTLQVLNLSFNQLRSFTLPSALTGLKHFDIGDNKGLEELVFPEALPELQRLDVRRGKLTELKLPAGFAALWFAELQYNQLSKLEILGDLPQLLYFDLSHNQLTEFAMQGRMKRLETLLLIKNQFRQLHQDFLKPFPRLNRLRLEDNPLHESILINISEDPVKTCEAVQRYVADLAGGSKLDNESKVLLLGNGNVGKSCLVGRLVHNRFIEEWNSTHAISLEQFPQEKSQSVRASKLIDPYLLNLWDFGGQDIYHATHRIFMQANAVYLLLWDPKTESEETSYRVEQGKERSYQNHGMQYWLSYAKTQGKDSPTIVVQTKMAKHGKQELPGMREAFGEQIDFLRFLHVESAEDDWKKNGYEELVFAIHQAVQQIKVDSEIPESWVAIRQAIRDLQKAHQQQLELQEFYHLAQEVQEPMDVLNWLTQSGVVFYQSGLFNDEIILDQGWAIEAVYTLFDREKLYYKLLQGQNGRFSGEDLSKIWEKNTEAEQELFISFMISCEMCFEETDREDHQQVPFLERTFIAPQLLHTKPTNHELRVWGEKQALHIKFEHRFLHYGVIQSFIVRAQKVGRTELMWRTGILLTTEENPNQMVQVEEAGQNCVRVKATPDALGLLAEVRKELAQVQGSEADEYVSGDGEHFVSISHLKEQAQTPNPQIKCENGTFRPLGEFGMFLRGMHGEGHWVGDMGTGERLAGRQIPPSTDTPIDDPSIQLPSADLPRVYLSYDWANTKRPNKTSLEQVNAIYHALRKEKGSYHVLRPSQDLAYGQLMSQFVEEMTESDLIVVFVSDAYFRSEKSMSEMVEIARLSKQEKDSFSQRILTIRIDELEFDDPEVLDTYYDYWEGKRKKWNEFVQKRLDKGNISESQVMRQLKVQKIEQYLGDIADWIFDMHASTLDLLSQDDYAVVKRAIEDRLS